MIIEIVFVLRGIKDMKLKHKIDKVVSTISERISSGGVSQLEVKAEGERDIFGNMPNLIREAAGEGIVLLKITMPCHIIRIQRFLYSAGASLIIFM